MTNVERIQHSLEVESQRRIEEIRARQELSLGLQRIQPSKTLTTYSGKMLEFSQWCREQNYPDNDTVTEDKAIYFLQGIKHRQRYKRGRKSANSQDLNNDQPVDLDKPLSYSTFEGYVNAIVKLWKQQHLTGRFPPNYPQPKRTPAMSSFLDLIKVEAVERENAALVDRGVGTMVLLH
jgi:hypothetical protein